MKNLIIKMAEKLTGRKCSRCQHNSGGRCNHPACSVFAKCWRSITRPGFEKKPPRYLKTTQTLTAEENHQLEKIKAALQEAEDTARESGLISED